MVFTVSTRTSQTVSDSTNHTVVLPDGSNVSGVRVLIFIGVDGAASITWPTGWTEFFNATNTDTRLAIAYRNIDGTEGFDGTDDSIIFTSGASEQSNHHSYLINGHNPTNAPEAAIAATGSGATTPDPPVLNPSGWGTEETLWIATCSYRFATTISAAPTNYTNLLALNGGDNNAPLGSARRILNAESEDPGTFTGGDSPWVATTVAVRPASSGAQELNVPFFQNSAQIFSPTVVNQSNQELAVPHFANINQIFLSSIENQPNQELNVPFLGSTSQIFSPQIFNEGDELFEPILAGNGSLADQIFNGLISQGFLTGSLADRERARLLAKLVLTEPQNLSIQDLYELADEDNRIAGLAEPVFI